MHPINFLTQKVENQPLWNSETQDKGPKSDRLYVILAFHQLTVFKGIKRSDRPCRFQSACFVAGDFCQYWNLIFQITDDFDILIMVSKAKFQKKLNGKTRFCQDGPNFVYFSIVDQDFLPQDQQLRIMQNWLCLDKIWFGYSISFEILL